MSFQDVLDQVKLASSGAFRPSAPLIWFVTGALVAPFVLLTAGGAQSNNLPWHFWAIVPTLLLLVSGIGFLRFTRDSGDAKSISISPGVR